MGFKEWFERQLKESKRAELISTNIWEFNFPLRCLVTPHNSIFWILNYGVNTDWHVVGKLKGTFFETFRTYKESKDIYLGLRNKAIEEGNCLLENFVPCPSGYRFPPYIIPASSTEPFKALNPETDPEGYTKMWWWMERHIKREDIDKIVPVHEGK